MISEGGLTAEELELWRDIQRRVAEHEAEVARLRAEARELQRSQE